MSANRSYYLANEGAVEGPFTVAELRQFYADAIVTRDSVVALVGSDAWQRLDSIPEMRLPPAGFDLQKNLVSRSKIAEEKDKAPTWLIPVGIGFVAVVVLTIIGLANASPNGVLLVGAILGLVLWPIPAFVAVRRNHPQATAIIILDLVAGWTFIGWVVALVWSFANPKK